MNIWFIYSIKQRDDKYFILLTFELNLKCMNTLYVI